MTVNCLFLMASFIFFRAYHSRQSQRLLRHVYFSQLWLCFTALSKRPAETAGTLSINVSRPVYEMKSLRRTRDEKRLDSLYNLHNTETHLTFRFYIQNVHRIYVYSQTYLCLFNGSYLLRKRYFSNNVHKLITADLKLDWTLFLGRVEVDYGVLSCQKCRSFLFIKS